MLEDRRWQIWIVPRSWSTVHNRHGAVTVGLALPSTVVRPRAVRVGDSSKGLHRLSGALIPFNNKPSPPQTHDWSPIMLPTVGDGEW